MIIRFNEKEIELPNHSTAKDLAVQLNLTDPAEALAVVINGNLLDLDTPLTDQDTVQFLSFSDDKGKEVFWHTSAHVLAQAVLRIFPEAVPTIGPAIEKGFYYDFANLSISDKDFDLIEKEAKKIIQENYKPKKVIYKDKEDALKAFENNPYKKELIKEKEGVFTGYQQGEFVDLCRGPHLPSLNKIKAFKIMKTSGAYWRGDQKNEMLTRIYGISFPDKKMLSNYLKNLEEAKKRDHKLLGTQLDLYSFKEEAPGMVFLHPKGMRIWNELLSFLSGCLNEADYKEIKTPQLMSKDLWIQSGHWMNYRDNMYIFSIEDREYALKPMNCPGCMLYYKSHTHSYRDLPLRISEIGHVHRHEFSGALHGLFRVRSFHQDDAHVFMEPKDIKDEIIAILNLMNKIYSTFGLSYHLELSTRPEKSIGTDRQWEEATNGLKSALDEWGHSYKINEGDGAFYGPKIDIHIQDALGRTWQCGTIQLDMAMPERFKLEYVTSSSENKQPVMIHRAIYGSIERFFGILVEHFAGKFPLWLAPIGVRLVPIADRHLDFAKEIKSEIEKTGVSCDIDDSHESVSKKIRNAQLQKINYMLTVGDKELENRTVSLRTRDNIVHGEKSIDEFIKKIIREKNERSLISFFETSQ